MKPLAYHTYAVSHRRGNAVVCVLAVTSDGWAYCQVMSGHFDGMGLNGAGWWREEGDWVCLLVDETVWMVPAERPKKTKHRDDDCEGK